MKTNQKGFAAVLAVLIAAVVLVGAGAYFYATRTTALKPAAQNETAVQPATQTVSGQGQNTNQSGADTTANWLVYEDETLGLRFKYPAEWGTPQAQEQEYYETIALSSRSVVYNISFAGGQASVDGFLRDANGDWANLDQPATSGAVSKGGTNGNILFREKITVAGQKTALTTGLSYMDEGSGIDISSNVRMIGLKDKYKFISVKNGSYAEMEKRLGVYYDNNDEELNKDAVIELNALRNGTTTDQTSLNKYKLFKQWLSTFEFIGSMATVTKTEILASQQKDLRGQAEKVQLADGTMCVFVSGATTGNAKGERMNYQCGDVKNLSMAIYGDLTEGDIWTANVSNIEYDVAKKAWNVLSVKTVDIAKLWR